MACCKGVGARLSMLYGGDLVADRQFIRWTGSWHTPTAGLSICQYTDMHIDAAPGSSGTLADCCAGQVARGRLTSPAVQIQAWPRSSKGQQKARVRTQKPPKRAGWLPGRPSTTRPLLQAASPPAAASNNGAGDTQDRAVGKRCEKIEQQQWFRMWQWTSEWRHEGQALYSW